MTERFCEDSDRSVRMISLPGGTQVGIQDLDSILDAVEQLQLNDDSSIQEILVQKTAESNYIADGAENQYGVALLKAYKKKFGKGGKPEPAPPKKKHAG